MSQLLDLTVDVSYTLYITDQLPFSSDDGRTFHFDLQLLIQMQKRLVAIFVLKPATVENHATLLVQHCFMLI